jgi:hypothetical protein
LKAKYRGLKKVIEAFPTLFQIGTDHIINPTISLKEPRRPGPIEEPISPTRLPDYSNSQQSNSQFQHNRNQGGQQHQGGNQSYSQYPNNNSRSNKYPNSNPRQNNSNESYYRSNPGISGGYNRNMDRGMMHQQQAENEEYYDPDGRYYQYDQYSSAGGGYGGSGHNRSSQNYSNNYPSSRNQQQQYNSRDTRGGGQQYPDYDYDPRWGQQEIPRPRSSQSHREPYGPDANLYQSDRNNPRGDSRYPQSWAAFQESENPSQRNSAASFYPRSEPREYLPQEHDDYRRDYDPNSLSQFHPRSSQEPQSSSGWLDIEGLIGGGNDNPDHYGGLDSALDLNFQM